MNHQLTGSLLLLFISYCAHSTASQTNNQSLESKQLVMKTFLLNINNEKRSIKTSGLILNNNDLIKIFGQPHEIISEIFWLATGDDEFDRLKTLLSLEPIHIQIILKKNQSAKSYIEKLIKETEKMFLSEMLTEENKNNLRNFINTPDKNLDKFFALKKLFCPLAERKNLVKEIYIHACGNTLPQDDADFDKAMDAFIEALCITKNNSKLFTLFDKNFIENNWNCLVGSPLNEFGILNHLMRLKRFSCLTFSMLENIALEKTEYQQTVFNIISLLDQNNLLSLPSHFKTTIDELLFILKNKNPSYMKLLWDEILPWLVNNKIKKLALPILGAICLWKKPKFIFILYPAYVSGTLTSGLLHIAQNSEFLRKKMGPKLFRKIFYYNQNKIFACLACLFFMPGYITFRALTED